MSVQDPSNLREHPADRAIAGLVRLALGLYTKGATFSEPLLALGMGRCRLILAQSASSSAAVDFTLDGNHDFYLIYGANVVPATDPDSILMRVQVGGSFVTASYDTVQLIASGATAASAAVAAGAYAVLAQNVGSAAGESCSFLHFIFGPSNTALYKRMLTAATITDASAAARIDIVSSAYEGGTGAVTGVRYLGLAGVIESGEFALYGLGKAAS